MIELRPYQKKSVESLRNGIISGQKKQILCAPTGAGKTVMFSYMVYNAIEKGKRVLIITDRIELLTQAGGTLSNFGLKPVEINSTRKLGSLNAMLYVAMSQTLTRRIKQIEYQGLFRNLDLIIIDEAHKQSFNSLLPYINEKCIVVGATATPYREKNQKCLSEFYQSITEVVKISELIKLGFLANPISYGVKVDLSGIKTSKGDYDEKQMGDKYTENKIYEGVYDNYQRITPNKKAIIFASNVESSIRLVTDFKEKGLPIEHIDGNTPKAERKRILKWFSSTPNALISNVGILNAGFDEPNIEVVILYRATMSLSLFLQMCGRGSRVTGTKKNFHILDFGNNIQRHGFWENDRVWTLKKKAKRDGVAPVKECPICNAMLAASVRDCNYCGYHFEPTEKEKEEAVIVELQQLSNREIIQKANTADFATLELIQKAKGYSKGWIYHKLKTEKDLIEYAEWKGYKRQWVDYQLELRKQNDQY